MKVRMERTFPHSYITGIHMAKHFQFEFPTETGRHGNKEIMKLKKDADFKELCNVFYNRFPHKQENPGNFKRLADATDTTICIRTSGGILRHGSGLYNYKSINL